MDLETTIDKVLRVMERGLENYTQAEIEELFVDLNFIYIWGTFDDFYYKHNALIIEYCYENFRNVEAILDASYSDNYNLVYEYIMHDLNADNETIVNFILDFMWLLARKCEGDFDKYAASLVERLLTLKLQTKDVINILDYNYHGLGNVDAMVITYVINNKMLTEVMNEIFNSKNSSKILDVVKLLPDGKEYAHYKLGINI